MKTKLILVSLLCLGASITTTYAKESTTNPAAQAGSLIALGIDQLAASLKESGIILSDITEEEITQYLQRLPAEFLTRARGAQSEEEFTTTFVTTAQKTAALLDRALVARQANTRKTVTRSRLNSGILFKSIEPLMHKTGTWVAEHKVLFLVALTFVIINLQHF